jgi:hypothetical protein
MNFTCKYKYSQMEFIDLIYEIPAFESMKIFFRYYSLK